MNTMAWLVVLVLSFLCGALPFSVWLSKLAAHRDVRDYGDGNPGAMNAFKSGGKAVGLLVLLLDISKAAAPVGLAYQELGYRGGAMFLIALAPVLGHVFSPFLRFRGGKGIAAGFGVLIGLAQWKLAVPAVLLVLLWMAVVDTSGWALMFTLAGLAVILALWMPDPLLLAVSAALAALLAWTHREHLRQWPRLRPWLAKLRGTRG